jgi:hypothetical protein
MADEKNAVKGKHLGSSFVSWNIGGRTACALDKENY